VEIRVLLPEGQLPVTIAEVVSAVAKQGLEARHDKQNWGDWIVISGKETVISIESARGLASSAIIEGAEGEDEVSDTLLAAFRKLGWDGEDEDGRYRL